MTLESYFMTADKGSIEIILSNFVKMESKMSSGIKFKCVGDKEVCDGTAGYVNKIPLTPIRLGPIHICIKNYRLEKDFHKTKVIIHEAAHRFIKADDRGYFGIDANDKLKGHSKLAIDNADSYAWFAMNS